MYYFTSHSQQLNIDTTTLTASSLIGQETIEASPYMYIIMVS